MTGTPAGPSSIPSRSVTAYAVPVAMVCYALALFGSYGSGTAVIVSLLLAPVVYFLAMYLYYGIARLAFERRHWLLGASTVMAVAISLAVAGSGQVVSILAAWCTLIVTGILVGKLTEQGYRPLTIVIAAMVSLVVFGVVQYLPIWREFMKLAPEQAATLTAEIQRQLAVIGESPDRSRQVVELFNRMTAVILRLAPAEMLLGVAAQFAVGYLLFVRWVDTNRLTRPQYEPFIYWKAPYSLMSAVVVAAVVRLLGGESLQLVADNVLAFLAVFYLVTGMALVEYFLRKIHFSTFMKVLFYIFLFLLPLANLTLGIVASVVIFLLGFADSFADWRRVHLREYV